jgi:hypothetical protein
VSVRPVYDAWHNPGRAPDYHEQEKSRLRHNWPVLGAALDQLRPDDVAQIITVHHHDLEDHAASFNDGYESAMAQHLSTHPTTAQDWLDAHNAEVRAAALEEASEAFTTGEWSDAFITSGVEDDVSAVRAFGEWMAARAATIREAAPELPEHAIDNAARPWDPTDDAAHEHRPGATS